MSKYTHTHTHTRVSYIFLVMSFFFYVSFLQFQVRPHSKDATPKLPDTRKQAEGHQDADASAVEEGSSSSSSPHHHWGTYRLELHSFSPGKESWEMTSAEKWTWVKAHKERGSQRFGKGDVWGASDCYCRAVKLLITLTERKNGEKKKKGMVGMQTINQFIN